MEEKALSVVNGDVGEDNYCLGKGSEDGQCDKDKDDKKKSVDNDNPLDFVDLGCGNGFLVHILTQEGYKGLGVDLQPRQIWQKFPESRLISQTITPNSSFKASWIIGNHSDELSPWIPIMARQTNSNFFLLPCCMFDLDGSRWAGNGVEGRYRAYCTFLEEISSSLGFHVEREALRIPSTKNIALIGRAWSNPEGLEDRLKGLRGMSVKVRKSDQEKTREWFMRAERKKNMTNRESETAMNMNDVDLNFVDFELSADLFD